MSSMPGAATGADKVTDHPFYPIGVPIPGYQANTNSVPYLLGVFSTGCTAIFLATSLITKAVRPRISTGDLVTVMWFVLSGSIHFWFEGYYAINQDRIAGLQTLFAQLWKEYALADSRYLTQNAFVLCMESITAVCWGPLCYIVAGLIATDHELRYPLQAIVSLGQLYGDILYYSTSAFDHYLHGVAYSRPEAMYFWVYMVVLNAFWIAIPGYLIYQSVTATGEAFRVARKVQAGNKRK